MATARSRMRSPSPEAAAAPSTPCSVHVHDASKRMSRRDPATRAMLVPAHATAREQPFQAWVDREAQDRSRCAADARSHTLEQPARERTPRTVRRASDLTVI